MGEPGFRVETTARLAQWRIENLASCTYRKSDPFKIGMWNWHISLEKNKFLYVRLFPEPSRLSKEQPPIASFAVRILTLGGSRRTLTYPEIIDKALKSNEDFVWPVELTFHGKFIIDVEFLDLKVASPNGGEPCSIWSSEETIQNQADQGALKCLDRMLGDGLHADVIINTSNGSIGAHRAVLAARSPVFESMFAHDLKEKESSTIDIEDMSIEACRAFLSYIYGCLASNEFQKHRIALLRAADKYDIGDLKEACEESLLDDINCKNVLGRLQNASLYHLPQLKQGCMKYLIDFGKVFDLCEEFNMFLQCADRDLIVEIFHELLNVWKGC
eukprot:Gb_00172 [translate_table: standard]